MTTPFTADTIGFRCRRCGNFLPVEEGWTMTDSGPYCIGCMGVALVPEEIKPEYKEPVVE